MFNLIDVELVLFDCVVIFVLWVVLLYWIFFFIFGYGYIVSGNLYSFVGFDLFINIDLDGNGILDCFDLFFGYNSVFGVVLFGVLGGCWNVIEDGSYCLV